MNSLVNDYLCSMDTLELVKILISLLIGAGAIALKNEFFKGRKTKQIDTNSDEIKSTKERISILEQRVIMIDKENAVHEEKILAIRQDHYEMNKLVDKLSYNLDQNTQAVVSLKATNDGVKELLANIFDGKIIINHRSNK